MWKNKATETNFIVIFRTIKIDSYVGKDLDYKDYPQFQRFSA